MNLRNVSLVAICAVGVAVMCGCRTNMGGGVLSSTMPVEQGKYTVIGDRVSGSESSWFGPFGISYAKPGSAVLRSLDEAKAKVGADALIEYSTNVELVNWGPFKQIITRIEGTPVKLQK